MPIFDQIEIFLDPNASSPSSNADTSFIAQDSMSKASLTTKLDSRGALRDFSYRHSTHEGYVSGGHLDLQLPEDTNTIDLFDIRGDLINLNYHVLRSMYDDLTSKSVAE